MKCFCVKFLFKKNKYIQVCYTLGRYTATDYVLRFFFFFLTFLFNFATKFMEDQCFRRRGHIPFTYETSFSKLVSKKIQ